MAQQKMKFKAHQSFFIRKGWLSKGLREVASNPDLFIEDEGKAAMDSLGLGFNMVKALRYWMQAVGLTVEPRTGRRPQTLTHLGQLILERDPYIEEMGSLWALHCNLASQRELATSWYVFFNEFRMRTFSKEDFVRAVRKYATNFGEKEYATKTIEDDFTCILNTYITHERLAGKLLSPEDVIDCPLGDLQILDVESSARGCYRKKQPSAGSLPSELVMYAMLRMDRLDERELRIEDLLNAPCSPGRLFNLDSASLISSLYELENNEALKVVRTAGLDVVRITTPDLNPEAQLRDYYDRIG